MVMPRDLVGGAICRESLARVSKSKAEELDRYRLEVGDILLARRGRLGRCALVRAEQAGWLCGTGCFRVRLGRRMDPPFLVQYLQWEGAVHWLSGHAVGQTMANLNTEILSQIPVWAPALTVQRWVVRLLENLEKAVRLRRELLESERGLQATLLQDFQRAGERDLHRLPGWRIARLDELCQLVDGHRFHSEDWSDEGEPILRIQNLNGSRKFKYFSGFVKAPWWVEPGDLLLPWAGALDSVKPYLWRGPRGLLNQHIFRIVPRQGVDRRWLFEALRLIAPQLQRLSQGFKKNLVHLRRGDVARYPIAVPPVEQQLEIAHMSRRMEERSKHRSRQIDLLEQLKRGLRGDLLSGRKSISEAQIHAGGSFARLLGGEGR